MSRLDNFSDCLNVLKNADFEFAENDDIYRTGIIGQFILHAVVICSNQQRKTASHICSS